MKDLRKVFIRCKRYNLRMNSLKCGFDVSSEKILGVHRPLEGINLDPVKIIQDIGPPATCKQLKSFIGRVFYVQNFILALAELHEPFSKLLRKNAPFNWDEEQLTAF